MRMPIPPRVHNPEHDYLWYGSSSCLPRTYALSASHGVCQSSKHLVGCSTYATSSVKWAVMESNHPSPKAYFWLIMGVEGIEPTRCRSHGIYSPANLLSRLHSQIVFYFYYQRYLTVYHN